MTTSTTEMAATARRISGHLRRSPDVRELASTVWYRLAGTPDRKSRLMKRVKVGGPILAVALALALYFIFRPVPQPDYRKGRLNKVFNYTLLTDEFNKLPVEKRMELIGQLVQRLKNMSSGDSVFMAAFAAGIAGSARKQIEENASRLAIDLWDKYAKDYSGVKPENRGEFLDNTFIEFMQMMSTVSGEPMKKSPSEMLADARKQAERDKENLRDPNRQPPNQALGRMFGFMQGNVGGHATPSQRSRGQLMMRDMVRRMRGEDVSGGPR